MSLITPAPSQRFLSPAAALVLESSHSAMSARLCSDMVPFSFRPMYCFLFTTWARSGIARVGAFGGCGEYSCLLSMHAICFLGLVSGARTHRRNSQHTDKAALSSSESTTCGTCAAEGVHRGPHGTSHAARRWYEVEGRVLHPVILYSPRDEFGPRISSTTGLMTITTLCTAC